MSVSERQYQGILKVIEHLNSGVDSHYIRERAGFELLQLLRADYFASFVWNPDGRRFAEPVFINMDPGNLERYYAYYQFHNPISRKMQSFRRAVCVNEVVPQRELVRTEFYNDFLARDGLYHGLNLYVYDGDRNLGDMRIWRSRRHPNFDDTDLRILEIVKPHFCNAMRNIQRISRRYGSEVPGREVSSQVERIEPNSLGIERLGSVYGLTLREAQITLEIAHGKTDQQIAESIGISFSTIRTHINHVYDKLGIRNRAALARLICAAP